MAYKLVNFDGLAITEYLQRGDEQNLGTGSAQTHFVQLPGGGYYRTRRGKRSPQGIRPITKSCVLWGDDAEDTRQQLDAWRAKIGVYGKLTVLFDDGEYRWQWAELQDMDAPRAADLKSSRYLPLSLTWQTVAQNWNGLIQGEGWEVGDGSFYLGDGTAEVGQNSLSYDLGAVTTTGLTITNNGNIDATNLVLTYNAGATQPVVRWANLNSGHFVQVGGGGLAAGEALRISTRDMTIAKLGAAKTITSIRRAINTVTVDVSGVHGLSTGDDVEISGTDDYDGIWTDVTVTDTNTFTFAIPGSVEAYGTETSGTVREYTDMFGSATFSDLARWFLLKPGANTVHISTNNSQTSDTALVEFYDHYA